MVLWFGKEEEKKSESANTGEVSITLGVPCTETVTSNTALCLLALQIPGSLHIMFRQGPYIHDNRNAICQEALNRNCSHVFFVDYDMWIPGDTLIKLLAHDKDIVAGYYNMRKLPLVSTTKLRDPFHNPVEAVSVPKPDHIFEAWATGTGCMLIKTGVFRKIDKPWFNVAYEDKKDPQGGLVGEDMWFCRQAQRKGIKVWVDPTIPIRHLGEYPY